MRMNIFRILVALFILALVILPATTALAIDLPDSTPTASMYIYRNLLETGDWLILIYHNIPYTTEPDDPIWQTYMWRLVDTDNTTVFGTALSTSWNSGGYGYSLSSMYFDAGNATANGMVWDTPYTMRLSGNPTAFAAPPEYNFVISTGDYDSLTSSTDVKASLAARVLQIAVDLDVRWGYDPEYSLLNEIETGTVLSIYGEAFFRNAIYGLQGLCPQIFAYTINELDLTERTWGSDYVDMTEDQWSGTWVETAKDSWQVLFGTTYDLTSIIISVIICGAILIIGIVMYTDAWLALLDVTVAFIVLGRLNMFDIGFVATVAGLAIIIIGARLWGVFQT